MKTHEFKTYLRTKIAVGQHWFLKEDVVQELCISSALFNLLASRLAKESFLHHLGRGFFIIISDKDSLRGAPYPAQFLDGYMNHVGVRYYVSLLEGAFFYGATHQQPQIFQVLTEKSFKHKPMDDISIAFHMLSHRFLKACYTKIDFDGGPLIMASREQVCVDVVTFFEACGYWNIVATIIAELAEACDPMAMKVVVLSVKTTDLQRLGYLFDLAYASGRSQAHALADVVQKELEKRMVYPLILSPHEEEKSGPKELKWKLIVNDIIEYDE